MGITAVLQREDGTELGIIEDPTNVLHRLLPQDDDTSYYYINRIDWYGDTVFNYLQAPRLLTEWQTLEPRVQEGEPRRVFEGILRLVQAMAGERHTYLKFVGD